MVAAALLLALCVMAGECSADAIGNARLAVQKQLYAPKSAVFKNVRVSPIGDVCGEVDSQNIEGGRTGFAHFVYDRSAHWIAA